MSFFQGFEFRTATPSFEPGDVIEVVITGYDREADTGVARIGDTVLSVEGVSVSDVDDQEEVEIIEFNPGEHRGKAKTVRGS